MAHADRSTTEQRSRTFIQLLDEKIEYLKQNYCDKVRYLEDETDDGKRKRRFQWKYHDTEFLLNYIEVPDVPGTAVWRIRHQPTQKGALPDNWMDVKTLGEFDDLIRLVRKRKGLTAGDLKAIAGNEKHKGAIPEGIILLGYSGSHAYNLNHNGFVDADGKDVAPSDIDLRGVFVVPTKEILMLGSTKELVEVGGEDTKFDEVQRFLELCLKANPERLEMLGCPRREQITPEGQLLVDHQRSFLSKRVIKTYGGYAKGQLYRIEHRQDRSSKPVMHLLRLMLTGIHILREGFCNPDMTPYRDRLLGVRKGEVSLEEAFAWYSELEAEFALAADQTKLPEFPDSSKANEILLEIRRNNLTW